MWVFAWCYPLSCFAHWVVLLCFDVTKSSHICLPLPAEVLVVCCFLVYPMKYAHGFVVVIHLSDSCDPFTHLQLPQCWGSNPEFWLTHWGRVTHMCVRNLTIIGSDNGLSPGRRQAIILTNAGILLIVPLGTNFSEIFNNIHTFSSRKCIWKGRLQNGGHFVSASMC